MRASKFFPLSSRPTNRREQARGISLLIAFAVFAASAGARGEPQPGIFEMPLSHALAPGEDVWLQLRVPSLPRGTEIRVSTLEGTLVGTATPFGAPQIPGPATYTIPLPKTAIVGGIVKLHIDVDQAGAESRPARPDEVEGKLLFLPDVPAR